MGKRAATQDRRGNGQSEIPLELQRGICEGKIAVDEVYDALRTLSIFSGMAIDGALPRGPKTDCVLSGAQVLIDCLAERAKAATDALWKPFLSCDATELEGK